MPKEEPIEVVGGECAINISCEALPAQVRQITSIDSYSGHADKNELKRYVEHMSGSFKKINRIHGEESQCFAHAESLRGMKPNADVLVPQYKQVLEI